LIDFHCHLDLYPDPSPVLERLGREQIYVLAVTTTPLAWDGTRRLIGDQPRVRIALGLHPQVVAERHKEVDILCARIAETRYVGEIGLDGSPEYHASFTVQQQILKKALSACASNGGRVISMHSRRAVRQVLDAIEAQPRCGIPVMHWFSGTPAELGRAVELDCWFSVGPAMLRSERGRKLAEAMPRDRVLTETDGPFAKAAGRPLMPWDAGDAEEMLAGFWKLPHAGVTDILHRNLRRLVAEA
jgi:TatD DNase family protein